MSSQAQTETTTEITIPEASHTIKGLAANATATQQEATLWTKYMENTINLKIKLTKQALASLLLLKLRNRKLGTNKTERYAVREIKKGRGGEKEQKKLVNVLMKQKIGVTRKIQQNMKERYQSKQIHRKEMGAL